MLSASVGKKHIEMTGAPPITIPTRTFHSLNNLSTPLSPASPKPDSEHTPNSAGRNSGSPTPSRTSLSSLSPRRVLGPDLGNPSPTTSMAVRSSGYGDSEVHMEDSDGDTPVVLKTGGTDLEMDRLVQHLCEFENGFPLLCDRIRQELRSTQEAVTFLKKRAAIEEEYARAMLKLAQTTPLQVPLGKEGTYADTWARFVKMHEATGETHLRLSESIHEVSEELTTLHRNAERSRKQLKDSGQKQLRLVHEADAALEKAKTKYESTSEDWERAILNRDQNGDSASTLSSSPVHNGSGVSALQRGKLKKNLSNQMGLLKQGLVGGPKMLQKAEDDARHKAAMSNENYKQQLHQTNAIRTGFFKVNLPRFIRALKEASDECDQGLQYHLTRYAQEMEAALMKEATTLSPLDQDEPSLIRIIERIDNERDFEDFMTSYLEKQRFSTKSEQHHYSPYPMSTEVVSSITPPTPVFGLPLISLMERDGMPVPSIVLRCIEAVDRHGLDVQGIYRMSGTNTHVQKLRAFLNKVESPQINLDDWVGDIHNITGVLKLYFRELPDPLLPKSMYRRFIDAACIEDDRVRLIGIHELINQLHDANYATLQSLAGHLFRVRKRELENKMTAQNLSIVWGPTLMDPPEVKPPDPNELKLQSLVIETILVNYDHIFEVEEEPHA